MANRWCCPILIEKLDGVHLLKPNKSTAGYVQDGDLVGRTWMSQEVRINGL